MKANYMYVGVIKILSSPRAGRSEMCELFDSPLQISMSSSLSEN